MRFKPVRIRPTIHTFKGVDMAIKHEYRINGNGGTEIRSLTPLKAIRKHCLECMGFSPFEVEKCTNPLCALYPFRLGTAGNPVRNTVGGFREQEKPI
jgi:hypothetical protein